VPRDTIVTRGVRDLTQTRQAKHQDVSKKHQQSDKQKHKDKHKDQKKKKEEAELFSFKSNNMQFFLSQGMKEATGYGEPKHWYFVIIKEPLDNAIDWLRDNYRGSDKERVTASFTINEDYSKFNCKVRNSNPANKPIYAFTQLPNILNYNMTFGSKQNEYRATRGQLGDGLKRLMGLPFILMNMGDTSGDSAFFKKQWDIPMYFRANGVERQAVVKVNLGASEAVNEIAQSPERLSHTDTEVEITFPIIEEAKEFITVSTVERHCRLNTSAVTDISFDIEIVDKAAEAKALKGCKRIITLEAKHPIPKNLQNATSIEAYRPDEFVNRVESLYHRENTSVYEVIRKFKEGAQMPKPAFDKLLEVEDASTLSIADFMSTPDYQQKMQSLYQLLMEEANK
jgi:hypothetical protein